MTHTNRGRLTVDLDGNWRIYTNTVPQGAEVLGVVYRDGLADCGALIKFGNGNFAQLNAGVVSQLDGRKVAAALGTAGRPAEMTEGKRVNVYLDAASLESAKKLGNGNVSEGIRKALKMQE